MAIRNDVSSLLDRIGRHDLRYREFGDPLGDMEMWPIFEALLQDRRIVGEAPSALDQRRRSQAVQQRMVAAPLPADPTPPPPPPPRSQPPLSVAPQAQPVQSPSPANDAQVRAFFGQLGAGTRTNGRDQ
ncbi:hypothetical protein [Croceibacterium ferulae]|uniref:hypothetical protein n=1 Tax=Croceibacterium ferulae TaxID=1854641 RepID=UPI000EAE64D7|nr:hypothetical protein [Croceibacterium ferulae]